MSNFKYIGLLAVFILGVMGYAYSESEVRNVVVTGKYVEDVHMRKGRTAQRYVLETSDGDLPILKFPLIGYSSGVEDVFDSIATGEALDVRVGQWPPRIIGDRGRMHIMQVY